MAKSKDAMLHIRIASEDLEKIKTYAEQHGMSQAEFCLSAIFAAMGDEVKEPVLENVMTRLAALERVVFQNQQAA